MPEYHKKKSAKAFARQAKIAEIVRKNKKVTVNELATTLAISKETIRRDLTALAKTGKVQKFHGGAALPTIDTEGSFNQRMGENVTAKALIAAKACDLISPGETVFIDTGSTTLYFAEKLSEIDDITVVTNSSEIAKVVSITGNNITTFLLGGQFNGDNRQTLGVMTTTQISSFQAHHAIITAGAIGETTGVMDYSFDEAQVAKAMIKQAEKLTVIADSNKFNKIASFKVCGFDKITNLVCESPPPDNYHYALAKAGVQVIIARPKSFSLFGDIPPSQ